MESIVTHPHFVNIGIPLISIALTLGLKICSKQKMEFDVQDLAIGLELFITSIALLLTGMIEWGFDSSDQSKVVAELLSSAPSVNAQELSRLLEKQELAQAKLTTAGIYLFLLMVAIFATTMLVRAFGWDTKNYRLNKFGIFAPTVMGVGLLFTISAWVSRGIS